MLPPPAPVDAAVAAAAAPAPPAALETPPPEKEKPAPRILLTVEAGQDNEAAGRDLAVVGGRPRPSDGTLARARERLDIKSRSEGGVVATVCEVLEAAIAEYRAK